MDTISLISGVVFFLAFVPYIRAIVNRQARPAKATWMIWAALDLIICVSLLRQNVVNWQIIGATLGAGTIAALSLKFGETGWTKTDKLCLRGAAVGIVLIFVDPMLATATTLTTLFVAAVPTFVSAWQGKEHRPTWAIFWTSCVIGMFAVTDWTLAAAGQPIVFLTINTIVFGFALFRRPTKQ